MAKRTIEVMTLYQQTWSSGKYNVIVDDRWQLVGVQQDFHNFMTYFHFVRDYVRPPTKAQKRLK